MISQYEKDLLSYQNEVTALETRMHEYHSKMRQCTCKKRRDLNYLMLKATESDLANLVCYGKPIDFESIIK